LIWVERHFQHKHSIIYIMPLISMLQLQKWN